MKLKKRTASNLVTIGLAAVLCIAAFLPIIPNGEINSRVMINTLGIDVGETVRVTAETSNGGGKDTIFGEGIDLMTAIFDMNERLGRDTELGHCGVFVFGSDITKEKILPCLLGFLSFGRLNSGCSVVIAEGRAEDLIGESIKLSKTGSTSISDYLTYAETSSGLSALSVLNVAKALKSKSGASYLSTVGIKEKQYGSEEKQQNSGQEMGGGGSSSKSKPIEMEITPLKKAKLLGADEFLEGDIVEGIIWMDKLSVGGVVSADATFGEKEMLIHATLTDKSVKVSGKFNADKQPEITLSVSADMILGDRFKIVNEYLAGFTAKEITAILSEAYKKRITSRIELIAEKCRQTDVLGFKNVLFRSDPKSYAEWDGDMSKTKINYEVEATVK